MESSLANSHSTSVSSGYALTPRGFARLRRTLNNLTGGQMPMSRFSFSHSVLNGVNTWTVQMMDKGWLSAHLYPSVRTALATVSSTSPHSYAIVEVRERLTSNPNQCLVMCMTKYTKRFERLLLKTLLQEWLRENGGWNLDISRALFSSALR